MDEISVYLITVKHFTMIRYSDARKCNL